MTRILVVGGSVGAIVYLIVASVRGNGFTTGDPIASVLGTIAAFTAVTLTELRLLLPLNSEPVSEATALSDLRREIFNRRDEEADDRGLLREWMLPMTIGDPKRFGVDAGTGPASLVLK